MVGLDFPDLSAFMNFWIAAWTTQAAIFLWRRLFEFSNRLTKISHHAAGGTDPERVGRT
jgi:hypothetical protein